MPLRSTITSKAGKSPYDLYQLENSKKMMFETYEFLYQQEVNLAYENVKVVDGLDVSKEGSDAWEAAIKRYGYINLLYAYLFHLFFYVERNLKFTMPLFMCF
jgi:hypothetical protein